jgi:hypothetical protein
VRANDSSARRPRHQPPCNLLVSSPCFRGHVFITLSSSRSFIRVVIVNNTISYFILLLLRGGARLIATWKASSFL